MTLLTPSPGNVSFLVLGTVTTPRRFSLVVIVGLVGSVQGLVFTKRLDSDGACTVSLPVAASVVGEGFRTDAASQVKAL